jgi:hypothetical protein
VSWPPSWSSLHLFRSKNGPPPVRPSVSVGVCVCERGEREGESLTPLVACRSRNREEVDGRLLFKGGIRPKNWRILGPDGFPVSTIATRCRLRANPKACTPPTFRLWPDPPPALHPLTAPQLRTHSVHSCRPERGCGCDATVNDGVNIKPSLSSISVARYIVQFIAAVRSLPPTCQKPHQNSDLDTQRYEAAAGVRQTTDDRPYSYDDD